MRPLVAFFALLVVCAALEKDENYGRDRSALKEVIKCKCITPFFKCLSVFFLHYRY